MRAEDWEAIWRQAEATREAQIRAEVEAAWAAREAQRRAASGQIDQIERGATSAPRAEAR